MKNRILALFVVMAMILTLTACGGSKDQPFNTDRGTEPQSQIENNDDEDNTSSELQEKWNGIWYGYMWVQEYYGAFEGSEFDFFDAFMNVDVDPSGKGTMQIYMGAADEYIDYEALVSANRIFIEADVTASEYLINVTEGRLLDATGDIPLDPEIWVMGQSYQDDEPQVTIVDSYRDADNDGFEYIFHFRIYGSVWEDQIGRESYKRVPPGYYGYIAELDNDGVDFSDGSGDDPASNQPSSSGPPIGGAGVTTKAKILAVWDDWLFRISRSEKPTATYEEVVRRLGDEGVPVEGPAYEERGHLEFRWTGSDGGSILLNFEPLDNGTYCFYQGSMDRG